MAQDKLTGAITSEDFMRLQSNPQHYSRMAIAEKISNHIENAESDTAEYALACDIAFYLQKEERDPVRIALAKGIAASHKAPKPLILLLARDREDEVAIPILKESPLLEDADLKELIHETQQPVRLVAVAERSFVSVTISALLIEKGEEQVTLTLLGNKGAEITDNSYIHIAQRHKHSSGVAAKLMARLPKPMQDIEKILAQADEEQENKPVGAIPSFTPISDELLKNDILAIKRLGKSPALKDCLILAKEMQRGGNLTAATLLVGLCLGQDSFFKACMALHTGLSVEKTDAMCEGDDGQFRALLTKARISTSLQPLMSWTLTSMRRQKSRGYKPNSAEFIIAMAKHMREAEIQGINFAKTIGMSIIGVIERTMK